MRELKNMVERLVILTPGPSIETIEPVLDPKAAAECETPQLDHLMSGTFKEARTAFEREFIRIKLSEHGGNVTQTAEAIDLDRTSLHKKMKSLGLNLNGNR